MFDALPVKRPWLQPVPRLLAERALRKSGPGRIEAQRTIEDPGVLAKPCVIKLVYRRASGLDRLIHDILDNDRSEVQGDGLMIAPPQH